MKIQRPLTISNVTEFLELRRWVDFTIDQLFDVLNGKISFSDNIDNVSVAVTFSAANTDTQVTHGLNRIPIGYIEVRKSASMVIYDGSRAWTSTNVYLKSSAAGTATLLLF